MFILRAALMFNLRTHATHMAETQPSLKTVVEKEVTFFAAHNLRLATERDFKTYS